MTTRKDLRDLKRVTREVTMWAREIERLAHGPAPAAPKTPRPAPAPKRQYSLPPEYSLVSCKDCNAPAILIRDSYSFAALCPQCHVITHLETIDDEESEE